MLESRPRGPGPGARRGQGARRRRDPRNVIWARYRPVPDVAPSGPKGFDGKNPAAYPPRRVRAARLVRGRRAGARHAGPADAHRARSRAWASRCERLASRRAHVCKPDPQLFGAFVRAPGHALPDRKLWSIWNEPNLRSWLSPQYESSGGAAVQTSAALYRSLATLGDRRPARHRPPRRPDLARRDRAARRRPVGCAPSASCAGPRAARPACSRPRRRRSCAACSACPTAAADRRRGMRPALPGLQAAQRDRLRAPSVHARRLACRRPSRTNAARSRSHAFAADAAARPGGQGQRIPRQAAGPLHGARLADQPAGRIFGVRLVEQAEYINQSDWIAYKTARVQAVAQYKIVDDVHRSRASRWACGFAGGARSRPMRRTSCRSGSRARARSVTVYGPGAPAPTTAPRGTVDIQNARRGRRGFQTVQTVPVTSANGTFTAAGAQPRAACGACAGTGCVSRQAEVAPQ